MVVKVFSGSGPAVVACGHAKTADAGDTLLREGGNAFDALAGAFFASCFCEPMLASLAGAGFFLLEPASTRPRVLDCFAQTPRAPRPIEDLDIERVDLDFGGASQGFQIGWGTVAVPGMIRGIYAMHRQLGHMPMRDIIACALEIGREAIVINDCQATIFNTLTPVCLTRPAVRELFQSPGDENVVIGAGEALDLSILAATLEVLAVEGEDFFYRGEIAALFEAKANHGGGIVTRLDLERYEVTVREAEHVYLADCRVSVAPAPSAGGMLVGFGLKLLQAINQGVSSRVGTYREQSELTRTLRLIDVMEATTAARLETTDQDGSDWPDAEKLLHDDYVDRWSQEIRGRLPAPHGTTHISIIDSSGNIASLSTSNGAGCGDILPGTGIMPNNMLGEGDLNPNGLFRWTPNTRLSSMMSPTIIARPDGTRLSLGSGGSNRIRTAMLQTISHLEMRGLSPEDAVAAPRIHVDDDTLFVEHGFNEEVVSHIRQHFADHNLFDEQNFYFGGVHVASVGASGVTGAGDSRRGGCVKIIAP